MQLIFNTELGIPGIQYMLIIWVLNRLFSAPPTPNIKIFEENLLLSFKLAQLKAKFLSITGS